MRRIAPASLRRRQLHPFPSIPQRPSTPLQHARPLTRTAGCLYPRSGPRGWSSSGPEITDELASQIQEENDDFPDNHSDVGLPPGADPPPQPNSFPSVVTSIISPNPVDSSLPDELRPLLAHVLTTFLPANQPCAPTPVKPPSSMSGASGPFTFHNGIPVTITEQEDGGDQADGRASEAVLALVNPFEGGKHYVRDAVERVASEVDAEVLRFDLVLGLGLDGPAAPLASFGEYWLTLSFSADLSTGDTAPELPQSVNPLLQHSPRPSPSQDTSSNGPLPQMTEEEGQEEGDEEPEGRGSSAVVVMPWSGRMPGLPGLTGMTSSPPIGGIKDDWVAFFDKILNRDSPTSDPSASTPRKRILLLESPEAMSATFDVWWPSLVEAVRQRRRGAHRLVDPSTPQKKGSKPKTAIAYTLSHPTTIILGSSPSLLLPHTASVAPFPTGRFSENGQHPIHPMLQEIAERFGGMVETKEIADAPPLWWGSEEFDQIGRMQREQKRLSVLVDDDKG